jgi:hypothetical protein
MLNEDISAEPCQYLSTEGAGLNTGEIHDFDAFEKEVHDT